MVGVVDRIEFCILTVNSQRILRQIVGSDAEEIYFLRQKIADHHRCRRLDHNSLLNLTHRKFSVLQFPAHFIQNLFASSDLIHRNDHRIHDPDISIGTGSEDRTKLDAEDFFPVQADPDRTVSHCRIVLMIQMEIVRLLVRADVQRTDNDFPARHILNDCPIRLKLFFLCRVIRFSQIQKFAPKQTDPRRIICQSLCSVFNASDIRIQTNVLSVQRHVLFALQFLQQFSPSLILPLLLLIILQCLLIRVQNQRGVHTVDNRNSALQMFVHGNSHQRRNIHRTRKDRRV